MDNHTATEMVYKNGYEDRKKFDINNLQLDKVSSDTLFVTADFCNEDIGVLFVGRRHGDEIAILNQFSGDEALEVYNKLVGA